MTRLGMDCAERGSAKQLVEAECGAWIGMYGWTASWKYGRGGSESNMSNQWNERKDGRDMGEFEGRFLNAFHVLEGAFGGIGLRWKGGPVVQMEDDTNKYVGRFPVEDEHPCYRP